MAVTIDDQSGRVRRPADEKRNGPGVSRGRNC